MKILRNTPDQMIVEDKPVLVAIFLGIGALVAVFTVMSLFGAGEYVAGGIVLSVAGLMFPLFLYIFVRRNQVILDKTAGSLTMRKRTLRGDTEVTHELQHLDRVIVESSRGDKTTTYRPTLVLSGGMSAGEHPIRNFYVSGRASHKVADAINQWLENARTS